MQRIQDIIMSFNDLGLSAPLLKAIASQGYKTPSPIQEKAIPAVLDGRDVMAAAQTGTGKTAGFTLPILQRLSGSLIGEGYLIEIEAEAEIDEGANNGSV